MLYPEKYNSLDDKDLLLEFRKTNNNAAVGILYKRYSHLVFGLCMKYLKSQEDAEDMVIHIFTKLFDDLQKHEIEYFKSWLYTYSKNHCLMHLRSFRSKLEKDLAYQENVKTLMESPDEMHLNNGEREKQLQILESAIENLSKEQKICIRMFYLSNKSYQEISEATGYSVNNVKSFIQNGKRNLKIRLEKENSGIN
jgi:RNA polymerase sigma factor (sigma-70 family)